MFAIARQARLRTEEYGSRDISNAAWAFAKLNLMHPELMDILASAAQKKLEKLLPQDLSQAFAGSHFCKVLSWSFSWSFRMIPSCRYQLNSLHVLSFWASVSSFSDSFSRGVSCSTSRIWSTGSCQPELLQPLVWMRPPQCKHPRWSQSQKCFCFCRRILGIRWTLAKLSIQDFQLLHAIAAASISSLSEYKPQEISNWAWALAKLGFKRDPLMDALAEAALRNVEVFKFSWFVWHCLGLCDLEFYRPRSISRASMLLLSEFNSQDLVNCAWSLAACDLGQGSEDWSAITNEVQVKLAEFALEVIPISRVRKMQTYWRRFPKRWCKNSTKLSHSP